MLSGFREDIQALRGVAVLVVVLYHAGLPPFAAGYLGVDIFFVISGFLITKLVKEAIEEERFSFSQFYIRRAWRLLPATYVTLFGAALASRFFLTSSELQDFREQLIGALTFTTNFVLWRQSGYFEGEAELKPLLHLWSLAIEEQYYLVLPAFLVLVKRSWWLRLILLALAASLTLCIFSIAKTYNFYFLPTRAWELFIGSVGAVLKLGGRSQSVVRWAFWPAMAGLAGLSIFKMSQFHPGPEALATCVFTLVVILRGHDVFKNLAFRPLIQVGNLSYSLYLVHWPLFAFLNNAWMGSEATEIPLSLRLAVLGVSFGAAYVLHRIVEEPFRRVRPRSGSRHVALLSVGICSLLTLALGAPLARPSDTDYAYSRRSNAGLSASCKFEATFTPIAACRTSDNPEIMVWGDSFAMHLVAGLHASGLSLVQATRSMCAPFIGISTVLEVQYDRAWAESCIAFNDSVLAYLRQTPSVNTVVLSSPFRRYVDEEENLLIRDHVDGFSVHKGSVEQALQAILNTARAVRELGKKVVVVAPPPTASFDAGRCIERRQMALVTLGAPQDCSIDRSSYRRRTARVHTLLDGLRRHDVDVVGFDEYLCDEQRCRTEVDGISVYRDKGHFSYAGITRVSRDMSLASRIAHAAK